MIPLAISVRHLRAPDYVGAATPLGSSATIRLTRPVRRQRLITMDRLTMITPA